MFPDAPIWEWKFFDMSIVVSALFFAAARPLWFIGKFLIYAAFASVSSWRWVVRWCVRLWMLTNWDIGAAIFGMVGRTWDIRPSGSSGDGIVSVGIDYFTESGDKQSFTNQDVQLPEDGDQFRIDDNDALELSYDNISRMNRREWYQRSFLRELVNIMGDKNANQLRKETRGKWYRSRALARWLKTQIRPFAEYLRR